MGFPCAFSLPKSLCLLPTIPSPLAPSLPNCHPLCPSRPWYSSNYSSAVFLFLCDLCVLSRYLSQNLFYSFNHVQFFFRESHCPFPLIWNRLCCLPHKLPSCANKCSVSSKHVILSVPMSWLCNKSSVVPSPGSVSSLPPAKSTRFAINTFPLLQHYDGSACLGMATRWQSGSSHLSLTALGGGEEC